MKTCIHCGWEVKNNFGILEDSSGDSICFWVRDDARPHADRKDHYELMPV